MSYCICLRKDYTMLSKILSKKTCAVCKNCCNYSSESLWDIPGFTLNEYENVVANYPQLISQSYHENNLYYFKTFQIDSNKYLCPFLKDNGCSLEKEKPFKCAIWPLYVVKHKNNIYLAISNVCPNIRITPEILENELQVSIQKIVKMIKLHPELIEIYRKHFTLLMQLNI